MADWDRSSRRGSRGFRPGTITLSLPRWVLPWDTFASLVASTQEDNVDILSTDAHAQWWNLGGGILSGALGFTTAYVHPNPLVSRLSLASGIASLLILPLTALSGLLPINDELLDKEKRWRDVPDSQISEADTKRVEELVWKWEGKHLLRYTGYAGAWVCAMAAMVLSSASYSRV